MCNVVHSVHTFVSEAHNSVSWIDHCIFTASAADLISDRFISNQYLWSDHLPMCITLKYEHVKLVNKNVVAPHQVSTGNHYRTKILINI